MKLLLLERQTFRQYYRYFATFISILLFTLMLFYVGVFKPLDNGSTLDIPFLVVLGAYTMSIPLILVPHLYHETNVHQQVFIGLNLWFNRYFRLLLINNTSSRHTGFVDSASHTLSFLVSLLLSCVCVMLLYLR